MQFVLAPCWNISSTQLCTQTVRATASQPSGRNSPALVLPPHAVNSLSKRSSSSSDGLSPATPTAEQGVHKSAASLDSSPPQQPAEGPTTSAASESSAASLSSILSRDLLIAGAADDYEGQLCQPSAGPPFHTSPLSCHCSECDLASCLSYSLGMTVLQTPQCLTAILAYC